MHPHSQSSGAVRIANLLETLKSLPSQCLEASAMHPDSQSSGADRIADLLEALKSLPSQNFGAGHGIWRLSAMSRGAHPCLIPRFD